MKVDTPNKELYWHFSKSNYWYLNRRLWFQSSNPPNSPRYHCKVRVFPTISNTDKKICIREMNMTLFMEWIIVEVTCSNPLHDEVWQQTLHHGRAHYISWTGMFLSWVNIWAIQVDLYDEIHSCYTSIPVCDFKPFLFNCFSDWSLGASVLVCHTYTCRKKKISPQIINPSCWWTILHFFPVCQEIAFFLHLNLLLWRIRKLGDQMK